MWVMVPSLSALRAPRPKSVDMDTISIAFSGVQMTALFELYLRWLDDPREPLRMGRFVVGARSRLMDEWTAQFLSANPDAVVGPCASK